MRNILKIEGVEVETTTINVDENTTAAGKLSVTFPRAEIIQAFSDFQVLREGTEIFDGRIEQPAPQFSTGGSTQKLIGYDYTILLTDYLTPSSSVVDSNTTVTLTELLTNTPFLLSVESTFEYLDNATVLDTTCEFLDLNFTDTCLEYGISEERTIEVDTAINTLPYPEFRATFWADTGTERFYLFYSDGAANLKYRHSDDCGATWSAEVDSGLAITTNHFSVMWYGSHVFVFLEDQWGNTDLYRGIITDLTGVIVFAIRDNNMLVNWMQAGPWVDVDGHFWVVENTGGNNDAWESVDEGVSWNNRFTGQEVLKYMLPQDTDGDMWCFEWDAGNSHLELWDYDRSAGAPEVYVSLIRDFVADDLQHIAGAQNPDYNIYLAYSDDDDDLWFRYASSLGAWSAEESVTTVMIADTAFHITADMCVSGYLAVLDNIGLEAVKIKASVYGTLTELEAEQGEYVTAPAAGLWDGEYSCHFGWIGFADDLWFTLLDHVGITLVNGAGTGSFQTDTITATGNMINWGQVTADGTLVQDDVLWSILKALDDSVLLSDQITPFDMKEQGLDPSETTIKIKADLTNSGAGRPYITVFDYSEYVDSLTMDFDYEDCFTAMEKWRAISGGEFWITEEDGVYTVHVSEARGVNKSDKVFLKNAKSSEYPTLRPNVKVVDYTMDWSDYANIILVIGSGSGSSRIEEESRNQTGVDIYGEHWSTVRNQDIQTAAMARSQGAVELSKRGTIIRRVTVEFVDDYDSGVISIGDTVTVSLVFGKDEDINLKMTMRILNLNRNYSQSGERVTVELSRQAKATLFYNYLIKTNSLERWVTA